MFEDNWPGSTERNTWKQSRAWQAGEAAPDRAVGHDHARIDRCT
jgi:hypothetical protein